MIVIGVTGGIATGKSFVAGELKKLGARALNADSMAHDCLKAGQPALSKVIKAFGPGILDSRGNADRRKLAGIVFNDKAGLKKLNSIIHPEVISRIKEELVKSRKARAVVIDAPLLIEANLAGIVDKLVVVTASRKKQYSRSARALGIGKEECERRLKNQIPLSRKMKMADFVIRNNGTRGLTRKQVKRIWEKLWR